MTTVRFVEKAIGAGVQGLVAVSAGGRGHSGATSAFTLTPRIRQGFDGVIVMAGAVSTGCGVLTAQALGADLVSIGTRFIAVKESGASEPYKRMLVEAGDEDVLYPVAITGVPASWLRPSIIRNGLEPDSLPMPIQVHGHGHDHLPENVRPWRDIWSAGQGMMLVADVPSVAELVRRLVHEHKAARDRISAAKFPAIGPPLEQPR